MMLIKILKRKDASSVLVAVVLAMILSQPLTSIGGLWANKVVGLDDGPFSYGPTGGWKNDYLFPVVWAVLQILLFEVLAWLYVYGAKMFKRSR